MRARARIPYFARARHRLQVAAEPWQRCVKRDHLLTPLAGQPQPARRPCCPGVVSARLARSAIAGRPTAVLLSATSDPSRRPTRRRTPVALSDEEHRTSADRARRLPGGSGRSSWRLQDRLEIVQQCCRNESRATSSVAYPPPVGASGSSSRGGARSSRSPRGCGRSRTGALLDRSARAPPRRGVRAWPSSNVALADRILARTAWSPQYT